MQAEDATTHQSVEWMLRGGGEMADLIRRVDWAATPLGPMLSWTGSLKTTVATILHSRHPMFLWWGPELVQIYNDAYMPSFGLGKHPSAMGQPGADCWPEIWDIIGPQIDDVMTRGIPSWHEDALVPIFRNGAIEQVYWTYGYSPVFDDDGRIGGTLVVCTETTGRVLASRREAALRADLDRDRTRLLQFFAQAPAGICIVRGPSLTFEFANDHYRLLIGGRDIVGQPLLKALPELEGQGLDTLLHGVMASGQPFVERERLIRVDRQGHGVTDDAFYTFVYSPLRDAEARVEAVIVLALDVTDEVLARQQAEELSRRLRESDAQFHLLAETIPQLAWSARPDGYIDWYNQRWYDYTGTTFESMQGWGWKAVHDPELVEQVLTRWQASLDGGEPFEMEFTLRRGDGQFRWHLTRAVPFRDETGRLVRWFGTNTDIDASRRDALERVALLENEQRARVAAEVASRAKDEFLATASHELRTPLNAILGWARMLQSGRLDQSGLLRAIDSIERNARIQVRLIEDILDGSRLITGQLHLETRGVDLTALINAALDTVRDAAAAKRIALTVDIDATAVGVVGDAERLQQVIWNLTNNAIKFTPHGGTVNVALRRIATNVQLQVTDTGEGISADFLPYVFDRFRQAEGSTSRRHGGLGLGLALVRHLVQAHRGAVRAESEGPGRGAVFTVTLPMQAAAGVGNIVEPPLAAAAQRFVDEHIDLRGVTVLVVDNEADALDLVATALRARGAAVTAASSAAEALALLSARDFMVMVSDIGMPITDGYELIQQVRTMPGGRGAQLPAVALTAYSREVDRRRALDAGFQAYVAKPVEPADLARVVAGLVTPGQTQGR
ncbi:MAG: PAS domain-containing protein [Vicinamibacterales bacterium]